MERDREIAKLTNVLRRIARAARYASSNQDMDATRFCVLQYNKVRARLSELEGAVAPLFTPLPETASADVVRLASHELAAFFEDEAPAFEGVDFGIGCHGRRRHRGHRGWAGVRVGCW
jgi:hypothetical protein